MVNVEASALTLKVIPQGPPTGTSGVIMKGPFGFSEDLGEKVRCVVYVSFCWYA